MPLESVPAAEAWRAANCTRRTSKESGLSDAARLLRAKADREEAEAKIASLRADELAGKLMRVDEARAFLSQRVAPIANDIDQMPRLLAAECNPSAPLVAENALRAWVEKTLKPSIVRACTG